VSRPRLLAPFLALPAVAAAGVATLWGEAMYAVHRALPTVTGHDPSGVVGDPTRPEITVLLLGDSTLTGSGLESPDDIWVHQMAHRLRERWRIRLVSVATGGARTAEVLDDQVPRALDVDADLAIVSTGANDVLHVTPLGQVERNLAAIVEQLLTVVPVVVLTGVGDVGNVPRVPFPLSLVARARSRAVDAVHERVAAHFDDVEKLPVGAMNAGFSRSLDLFAPDWFHPSRAGHTIWADAATPVVAEALEQVVRDRREHA
jgi:lysophospholipase L1-like esterase